MPELTTLKSLNIEEKIVLSEHARIRLIERGITVDDVINSINTGEIIMQYKDDKPFPSCLILGRDANGKYIHVVVSNDSDYIYLITAYVPNSDIWKEDLKTRKRG